MRNTALLTVISLFFTFCTSRALLYKATDLDQILETFHDPASKTILVAAHRSLHNYFPENSLASIKHAIETGIDIVELDVRQTRDSVLVLMHDETIDRTTNGSGPIAQLTFNELQNYFLLNETGDDTLTHPIPTLKAALQIAKNKIVVDIDIKTASIPILVRTVVEAATEHQVIFFEQDYELLDTMLNIDSTLMLMPRAKQYNELAGMIDRYAPPVIHIDDSFFTSETVTLLNQSGTKIWINGLGLPDIKARIGFRSWGYGGLIEGGANIIQTDNPLILLKYLRDADLHW